MKIAVFGAGRMAEIRIEDLIGDPRITGVSVINRTEANSKSIQSRFGIDLVSAANFDASDFDSYVITTSTDNHTDSLNRVLGPGKKILCEKPIALDLEETDDILRKAWQIGTEIQVGFQRRFDPPISRAKRLIDDGNLGTLYHLHFTSRDHQPSSPEFVAGSGGIFRDLHVHDFDLVEWLCGEKIAEVFATRRVREHKQYLGLKDGDTSLIHAVTTSGIQISIAGSRHDPLGHDVRFEVFGVKDSLSAGFSTRTPLHILDSDLEIGGNPYRGFVDRFREAFRAETRAYVDWICGSGANPCPPDSARSSTCVAIACEMSVEQRRVVRVAEVRGSWPG